MSRIFILVVAKRSKLTDTDAARIIHPVSFRSKIVKTGTFQDLVDIRRSTTSASIYNLKTKVIDRSSINCEINVANICINDLFSISD